MKNPASVLANLKISRFALVKTAQVEVLCSKNKSQDNRFILPRYANTECEMGFNHLYRDRPAVCIWLTNMLQLQVPDTHNSTAYFHLINRHPICRLQKLRIYIYLNLPSSHIFKPYESLQHSWHFHGNIKTAPILQMAQIYVRFCFQNQKGFF